MSGLIDARFTLIEGGQNLSADDLIARAQSPLPSGPLVYKPAIAGAVAGLIAALLAAQDLETDLYVQRDENTHAQPTDKVLRTRIWLQTSGTTGEPKWAAHDLDALTAKITKGSGPQARWLLTYHPLSFAGLQVILSALIGGHVLIAPPLNAPVADMAALATQTAPTHISGTPTFWRAFLMAAPDVSLKAITLGGEASDQAVLDALKARFPAAHIRHIYATTEAGVVFTVADGRAGFPSEWLKRTDLSLSDHDTLMVNGRDTHDVVSLIDNRVLFRGRRDSMVNIGGAKVFPEEVETFLLQCPAVLEARVSARPSPILGHVLTAEITLDSTTDQATSEAALKAHIQTLSRPQRPVSLTYVTAIETTPTGKKARHSA